MKTKLVLCTFLFLSWILANSQSTEGLRIINGTRLFIKESGKGDVLIVIHGGPGLNHSYFEPHLDPLAKKLKVVYYDQRACGQSAIPAVDSLSISYFIDDIEGIRKSFGVEKVNILAHSWGALLAVQFGMKYPEKVNKIILSNPVPLNQAYQQEMKAFQEEHTTKQDSLDRSAILTSADFKNGNIQTYEKLMKLIFRPVFYDPANLSRLNLNLPDNVNQANQALFAGIGKDLASYDYYEDVKKFPFRVMIIAGAADGMPMTSIERLKENLQKGNLIVFDKSGHFPFIEEPEKFNQEVVAFLKR